MPGHWTGITNPDGTPYNGNFNAVNNYGPHLIADTVKQMYGMIWSLASSMADETASVGDNRRDVALMHIMSALADHENGVNLGRKIERNSTVVARRTLEKTIDNDDVINSIIVNLVEAGVIDPTKRIEND
jgi:hypothetical protein